MSPGGRKTAAGATPPEGGALTSAAHPKPARAALPRVPRPLARVALLVLALPLVWIAADPNAGALDDDVRTRAVLGNRLGNLLRQEEAIAAGHYLADASGGSFTRDATERVGLNLWLADLALWRQLRGRPPPTRLDALSLQPWLCSLGVVALVVLGAPAWGVAWVVAVFLLFPAPAASEVGQRTWPQLLALGMALALVERAAEALDRRGPLALGRTVAPLFGWGLVAGLAGVVRDEAAATVAIVLAGLAAWQAAGWGIGRLAGDADLAPPSRAPEGRRPWGRVLGPLRAGAAEPRAVVAVAIALVGLAAASLAASANLRLFEAIEGVDHRPVRGRHLFWHPLVVGLGQDFHAQEHLSGTDGTGITLMHAETGAFRGYAEPAYERALRERWLALAWHNTPFVLEVYTHKLRRLLLDPARPRTATLGLLFGGLLALALARTARARSAGDALRLGAAPLLVGAYLGPGLMMSPAYATALDPALASAALLCGVVVARPRPGGVASPARRRRGRRVGGALLAVALLAVAAVAGRAIAVVAERQRLSRGLQEGTLALEAALDAYHADATLAFNALPPERRRRLAEELLAAGAGADAGRVELRRRAEASPLRAAVWRGDQLYVVLQPDRTLEGAGLPMRLRYREPARFPTFEGAGLRWLPPFDRVAERSELGSRLYVPDPLPPGTWLLSVRAPAAHLASIALDDAELVGPEGADSAP